MKFWLIILSVFLFCDGGYSQARAKPVSEASPAFSRRTIAKRITIESDGWHLVGDLRIPPSKVPVPAVLMLNKGNGSRDAYVALAEILSRKGIASLRLDLRAHGQSTNKGKFGPPFDAAMQELLMGSSDDVIASIRYLKNLEKIAPNRIGVIGASYSGEQMAIAGRVSGYGKAYVALSPGSFSPESINDLDRSGAVWLFVRSAEEKNLTGMHEEIRKKSRSANLIEVPGSGHATDLLTASPELKEMIVVWLQAHL